MCAHSKALLKNSCCLKKTQPGKTQTRLFLTKGPAFGGQKDCWLGEMCTCQRAPILTFVPGKERSEWKFSIPLIYLFWSSMVPVCYNVKPQSFFLPPLFSSGLILFNIWSLFMFSASFWLWQKRTFWRRYVAFCRFLDKKVVSRQKLQLVGVVAIIAATRGLLF